MKFMGRDGEGVRQRSPLPVSRDQYPSIVNVSHTGISAGCVPMRLASGFGGSPSGWIVRVRNQSVRHGAMFLAITRTPGFRSGPGPPCARSRRQGGRQAHRRCRLPLRGPLSWAGSEERSC
jgi:hypothetical protein